MADEVLRELEDEIRRDRATQLWRRYGGWIIGACVAAVLLTAALVGWHKYQLGRDQSATSQLLAALAETDAARQQKALQEVSRKNAGRTPAALAQLQRAAKLRGENNAEALAAYLEVAKNDGYDGVLRNVALIQALHAAADGGLKEAGLERELASGAPFYSQWQEARAWYAVAQGNREEALALFARIGSDGAASATQRQRLQMVAGAAAPDAPRAAKE